MPDYSAGSASVDIKPDFSGFVRSLRADLERVDASLDVQVGADTRAAADEIAAFRRLSGQDMSIRIDADTRVAADELAEFRRLAGRPMTIEVNTNTNTSQTRAAARAAASSTQFGGSAGSSALLNGGILGLSQLPAAATAVASIGTEIQALAQNAALLPAIFAGAAAGVGTLVIGFQGMKDAFTGTPEKAAAAMEGMAGSAKEVVTTVQSFGQEWKNATKTIQGNLFEGVAAPLRQGIDAQLPVVEQGMAGIATKFGVGFKVALGELGNDATSSGLTRIFDNTTTAAGNLNGAITPIINTVRTLGATGSDFLPELAQGITNLTTRFDAFITKSNDSGDLSRWMREGIDAAKTLGSVISNLGSSLASVLRAAKGDGDGFLVTVDKLTTRLSEWLKSTDGQTQMRAFFQQGHEQLQKWEPVLKSVGSILKSLYEASSAWSGVLLPFLQAAASLLGSHNGLLQTILISYFAYRTIGPIFTAIQTAIAGATVRLNSFQAGMASSTATSSFGRALGGLGAMLGTGGIFGLALAGAAIGIGLLIQRHQEAKAAADQQRAALEQLGSTLDKESGRVTAETVAQASETLGKEGFLTRAETLGVDTHDLTRASLGLDQDAKARINQQLSGVIVEQGQGTGKWNQAKTTGLNDQEIAAALAGVPEAVTKYTEALQAAQKAMTEAGSKEVLPDLSVLKNSLNDVGESAATLGGRMNDLNSSTAKLGDSTRQINEAKNGVHDLTQSGIADFDAFGVKVEQVTSANTLVLKSATDEQIAKLNELGNTATRLPDGTVTVVLNAEAAKRDIVEIVKPATKDVWVQTHQAAPGQDKPYQPPETYPRDLQGNRLPGRADGGPIDGGIAGRDSVPILAMPGEHMLTTSDVNRLGGQAGVYRFRAALQSGQIGRYANGGAVGWTTQNEIDLNQAEVSVQQAEEAAAKTAINKKASDADKRQAQLKIDEAKNKVAELEAKKTGRLGPQTQVLPQADLPGRRSDTEIGKLSAQSAVDDANTERNRVYADPNSTPEAKLKADAAYQSAQNALDKTNKSTDTTDLSLQGTFSKAGGILADGLLGIFGLENSVLSSNNVYNKALNTTLDFYNKDQQPTDGYTYQPKNLPVKKDDPASTSTSSDSSTTTSGDHAYDASAGVQQWSPTFANVLNALGMPSGWLGLGLAQMRSESAGNPKAINLTDSNAAKGIPSKGLMQVIDPTFASNRSPLYPNDIWDPDANIAAALKYVVGRYGSPVGIWGQGHGYADGGWAFGEGTGTSDSIKARLSHGEFVVNAASAAANGQWLEAINSGLNMAVPNLPAGMTPRGGDTTTSTNRDHSVNFNGDVHVMNHDLLVREQDRWATNQAMGALAAYS